VSLDVFQPLNTTCVQGVPFTWKQGDIWHFISYVPHGCHCSWYMLAGKSLDAATLSSTCQLMLPHCHQHVSWCCHAGCSDPIFAGGPGHVCSVNMLSCRCHHFKESKGGSSVTIFGLFIWYFLPPQWLLIEPTFLHRQCNTLWFQVNGTVFGIVMWVTEVYGLSELVVEANRKRQEAKILLFLPSFTS
jgi:hypothetical protein